MRTLVFGGACLTVLIWSLASCSKHGSEPLYHSEWLDVLASQDGDLVFVEHNQGLVAAWSPANKKSRQLGRHAIAPQAAALLRAAITEEQHVLLLGDGPPDPSLVLQPLSGAAHDTKLLDNAFDRLSAAPRAPMALAFNDPRYANPRRGRPGALAFACVDGAGKLHVSEITPIETSGSSEFDAGAVPSISDFPVAIAWSDEPDHLSYVFVADPLSLRVFQLSCQGENIVERAEHIDLRDLDARSPFEITEMRVQRAGDTVHVFASSQGSSMLLHVQLADRQRMQIGRLQASGPIAAIALVGDVPGVGVAALTHPTPERARIEIYRSRADDFERSQVDLDHAFDTFLSELPCAGGLPREDGMLVALAGGAHPHVATVATGLIDGQAAPGEDSGAVRTFELAHPALQAIRLADAVWILHGSPGATVVELGPPDNRAFRVAAPTTARLLPLTEPLSAEVPARVGCATVNQQETQLLWLLNPELDRVVAIVTSSRQQMGADLPAAALQLLPLSSTTARGAVIHDSAFGRATTLQIDPPNELDNQMGLDTSDDRYLFLSDLEGKR